MSKKIEDVINSKIKSGAQGNALDFIAHLRGSENISISKDDNDEGRWWIRDKDNLLCEIQIKAASGDSPDGWEVWFYGDCIGGHDSLIDEDVKAIAWANITLAEIVVQDVPQENGKPFLARYLKMFASLLSDFQILKRIQCIV